MAHLFPLLYLRTVLLNSLKNDEIYPFFWKARKLELTEVRYQDLALLGQRIAAEPSGVESHRTLEHVLYGANGSPVYTGWTQGRLASVLRRSGYEPEEAMAGTLREESGSAGDSVVGSPRTVTARLKPAPWSLRDRLSALRWRRSERIWAWRKALRAAAGTAAGRSAGLFARPDLKRGDLWLNLGAGEESYDRYLKVDWSGRQHLYDDIVGLRRIPNGSAERIYCNHVLEHIPAAAIGPMLRRWREILRAGGLVLGRIPDARQAVLCLNRPWRETTESDLERLGLPNFLKRESVRHGTLDDTACIQLVYGWSDSAPHSWDASNQHKTLWTPELARERFEAAGFTVERSENLGTLNTLIIARR